MTRAVLLPSPLLPAVAYLPLAERMTARGCPTEVAAAPLGPGGPGPVVDAFAGAVARVRPDLVLAHSNAGRYAPTVAGGIPVVFVDAALPPVSGAAPLAPTALLDHLDGLADADGLLPPWTRWWPEVELRAVIPDPAVLRRIRADEPRMPLAYFRSALGAPAGWTDGPCAYLAFGNTYAEETAFASGLGWPVRRIEGAGHLHHLVDADAVAREIEALVAELGVQ